MARLWRREVGQYALTSDEPRGPRTSPASPELNAICGLVLLEAVTGISGTAYARTIDRDEFGG